MNINDAFPSPFIAAGDLPDDGMIVTFQGVSMEVFEGEKNPKAICHFAEFDKGMLLNKTNKNTIVDVLGTPETNVWIGQRITIYPTECDYKGDRVACIRVKLRAPMCDAGDSRINAMLKAFGEMRVTRSMLEQRLGIRSIAEITPAQRDALKSLHARMVAGEEWPRTDPRPDQDLTGWLGRDNGELVVQRADW